LSTKIGKAPWPGSTLGAWAVLCTGGPLRVCGAPGCGKVCACALLKGTLPKGTAARASQDLRVNSNIPRLSSKKKTWAASGQGLEARAH
jgi:hypothetical protein